MKKSLYSLIKGWWLAYSAYMTGCIPIPKKQLRGDTAHWRDRSFVVTVSATLPLTILAFLIRIAIAAANGNATGAALNLLYIIVLAAVLLNKYIPIGLKKDFVILMIYLFSIILLLACGSSGPGTLYLMSTSIFTVFMYPGNKIYLSLLANLIISGSIACILAYQLIPIPLSKEYTVASWLNYSFNLLFINTLCLMLIQRVIIRLERIITKENDLLCQLADEAMEVAALNNKLNDSEIYYRYLFASNPIPMWVFDTTTLRFLQVNDAAVQSYGYSREEFLNMTIEHIRPAIEIRSIVEIVETNRQTLLPFRKNVNHQRKDKSIFPVEIRSNPIEINGKTGRLVLATDITERSRYIQNIEEKNKKLQDIAWIQSHQVRAPLTSIMSLVDLLSMEENSPEKAEIISYLQNSAAELNEVVTRVIKQAE